MMKNNLERWQSEQSVGVRGKRHLKTANKKAGIHKISATSHSIQLTVEFLNKYVSSWLTDVL